ncbi:hypothetical protein [Pasteuria penetrans]|nr:hypothetical protein [Pasteuria penetrans]
MNHGGKASKDVVDVETRDLSSERSYGGRTPPTVLAASCIQME